MENLSIQIADILKQRGLTGVNYGLLHGNMGLCIFYYHLARQTNNPEYEKIADGLLDQVFANLSITVSADFENGLAGIGWGIEYLVQNQFAEGNTDEILEEVDNRVFRVLNEETIPSFELGNGLTGFLFYLINRLKNKSNLPSLANRINRELLILTINKLDEIVSAQFPSIVKEMNFDLFWRFPIMVYALSEAFLLDIYNDKIVNMVRQWLPYIEGYLPSLNINRLYMSLVLSTVAVFIPERRILKHVKILIYATDFEKVKTEVDLSEFNLRFGWPGALCLLKLAMDELPTEYPNYGLIGQTYREISGSQKLKVEKSVTGFLMDGTAQFGISNGLAGVGLASILWPTFLGEEYFCQ
jgi:hypothetical protein